MYAGLNLMMNPPEFLTMKSEVGTIDDSGWAVPREALNRELRKFLIDKETLSAEKVQAAWFPQLDAHVFLSHAHADADQAKILAAWLHKKFGLQTFIDSVAWGYANDLLKGIDRSFNKNGEGTFSYEKTRVSAAHVHMILMSALVQMIDRCECLMFLNTLPPVQLSPGSTQSTESPWIYGELMFSGLLQRRSKEAHRSPRKVLLDSVLASEQFRMSYRLPQDHLMKLDWNKLRDWSHNPGLPRGATALDRLYKIAGVPDGIG